MEFIDFPDDLLRDICGRLPPSTQLALRHTCRDFARLIPKPNVSHIELKYEVVQKRLRLNSVQLPMDSMMLYGKRRVLLFQIPTDFQGGTKLCLSPDFADKKSAILRIRIKEDRPVSQWSCEITTGVMPQLVTHQDCIQYTLGLWHLYCHIHHSTPPITITRFYEGVLKMIKRIFRNN